MQGRCQLTANKASEWGQNANKWVTMQPPSHHLLANSRSPSYTLIIDWLIKR